MNFFLILNQLTIRNEFKFKISNPSIIYKIIRAGLDRFVGLCVILPSGARAFIPFSITMHNIIYTLFCQQLFYTPQNNHVLKSIEPVTPLFMGLASLFLYSYEYETSHFGASLIYCIQNVFCFVVFCLQRKLSFCQLYCHFGFDLHSTHQQTNIMTLSFAYATAKLRTYLAQRENILVDITANQKSKLHMAAELIMEIG